MSVRRLLWAGPLTIVTAAVAVRIIQLIAAPWLGQTVRIGEVPAGLTAILVAVAVAVFAGIAFEAADPNRAFRRVAFGCLLLSCVPVAAIPFGLIKGAGWTLGLIYLSMHVVAWAITVEMLTRLCRVRAA